MSDKTQRRVDAAEQYLAAKCFELALTDDCKLSLAGTSLRQATLPLALAAAQIALNEQPLTLRGLFYRVVSAGLLPSTDKKHYAAFGNLMMKLRENEFVPFEWLTDGVRQTLKSSSWTGLVDFADTVRDCYRRDFWSDLPDYIHVFCEKDAIAGVLQPATEEFDVALSPIRGYVSASFAHQIAMTWSHINKPIHAFFFGDFDASGFDLERDLKDKLQRYSGKSFTWERLGVNAEDFAAFDLLPLAPKESDRRCPKFVAEHGSECAEIDAVPSNELRRRVREAIEQYVDHERWQKLVNVERMERETWQQTIAGLGS